MTHLISFTNLAKGIALVAVMMLASASVVNAASASDVPSCSIAIVPTTIGGVQGAKLKWISTQGAIFASLDNGIGNIAPDGEMTIAPTISTVYTMHTWNSQGEGGYCSTGLNVDGNGVFTGVQPHVTLQTVAIHPSPSAVALGNVPYTGAAQNALYAFFLLALMLTAGYSVVMHRKTVFA
jgi:hypothetical protein